jgi:hypothetical protein
LVFFGSVNTLHFKMLKVITVISNTEEPGFKLLGESLVKHGWDTTALAVQWRGFGTKLIAIYRYLQDNLEIDRFIFCDGHDVVALGPPVEFERNLEHPDKMLVSAERGCWPPTMQQYASYYEPLEAHGWNYVNSGLYYTPTSIFMAMMERNMPKYESDDQEWLAMNFLFNDEAEIRMDRNCNVFQSYSFVQDDDYIYREGVLVNAKTCTTPCFVHGNGRTNMEKVYNLIK